MFAFLKKPTRKRSTKIPTSGRRTMTAFLSAPLLVESQALPLSKFATDITVTFRCQFHQHFTYEFFVPTSFFYVHVTRKSCRNATIVRKICTYNVDEIDYRCRIYSCLLGLTEIAFQIWPKNRVLYLLFIKQLIY